MSRYYSILEKQSYSKGRFSLVPIRQEDRYEIMRWRNEQIYHLRQDRPLTVEDQDRYFSTIVEGLFKQEKPSQILFSYLEGEQCIGYGGLVHMNWVDRNAEISFIMDTQLEDTDFEFHWITYLGLIKQIAFKELKLHKIYTYAFDLRPYLYLALEKSGLRCEARLQEHCYFEGQFIDVVIHSLRYPNVVIREAELNDKKVTFDWANNKQIRSFSYNRAPISWEEHESWFNSKLDNSGACRYFIMEQESKPIGSIRFDLDDEQSAKISYLLHPDYQGKGLGKVLLEEGIKKFITNQNSSFKIIGLVHRENIASVRLFEKLNFSKNPIAIGDYLQFELKVNENTK